MTPPLPARSASKGTASVLVIGYGNELRGDDGVGPCVARAITAREDPDVRAVAVHQLMPELAEALSTAALAIFVDAAFNPGDAVVLRCLGTDAVPSALGHMGDPQELLALTRALYGRCPEAWLLTVPAVRSAAAPAACSATCWPSGAAAAVEQPAGQPRSRTTRLPT